MTAETQTQETRTPLTRERVFEAAIALADRDGIKGLTMRKLAEELNVEAMSLYYHVPNKEAIFDGVVDALVLEIGDEIGGFEVPTDFDDWRVEARNRMLGARQVMMRHKWAPQIFETRTTISPATTFYFHCILGIMIEGGLSYDLAHHALHALGARALGFSQELFEPANEADEKVTEDQFEEMMEHLPYMVGMMNEIAHDGPDETIGWCDDLTEFKFSIDLVLDGLETRRLAEAEASAS